MLDQKVLSGSWMGERDEKYPSHHNYIYISIITIILTKDPFFAATKSNFLVTFDPVIFPLKCPYKFSDNNKI
jgi:hypothetical protein